MRDPLIAEARAALRRGDAAAARAAVSTGDAEHGDVVEMLAVSRDAEAQNDFVSIVAGTMSPVEFFSPEHLGPLMAATAGTH